MVRLLFEPRRALWAPFYGQKRSDDPADTANDIALPAFFGALCLFRNYHRVHHAYPTTKWYAAPRVYEQTFLANGKPAVAVFDLIAQWMRRGPRTWPVANERDEAGVQDSDRLVG
ncbi:fatty acid desaturase [Alkalilimnicola ehrlichii]|uniref:fatty acid desaturase n=1 Tax=Alkalilimnicola ehrlichii TaxID=351052 RepID=UPI00384DB311